MLLEESVWIKTALQEIPFLAGQVCLNIASSSQKYRMLYQPYIYENIFKPLEKRGVQVLHVDNRQEEGIDICLDITKKDLLNNVKIPKADLVICTNLLEHVTDIESVINNIKLITREKGIVVLSVPRFFGFHPDPIDTMFRPDHKKLFSLFERSSFSEIKGETIRAVSWKTYLGDVCRGYWPFSLLPRRPSSRLMRGVTLGAKFPSRVALVVVRKEKEC